MQNSVRLDNHESPLTRTTTWTPSVIFSCFFLSFSLQLKLEFFMSMSPEIPVNSKPVKS